MANSLCLTPLASAKHINIPGLITGNIPERKINWINDLSRSSKSNFRALEMKATDSDEGPKSSSILCKTCDGNGVLLCSQCKGTGVNSVDHFNGQFKAGARCWLCGGKKDMLCGDCNGAGFLGGFMSTFDE